MSEFVPHSSEKKDKDAARKKRPAFIPTPPVAERPTISPEPLIPMSREVLEHRRRMEAQQPSEVASPEILKETKEKEDKKETEEDTRPPYAQGASDQTEESVIRPKEGEKELAEPEQVADQTAEPADTEILRAIAREEKAALEEKEPDPAVHDYLNEIEAGSLPEEAEVAVDDKYGLSEIADQYLDESTVLETIQDIERHLEEQGMSPEAMADLSDEELEELAETALEAGEAPEAPDFDMATTTHHAARVSSNQPTLQSVHAPSPPPPVTHGSAPTPLPGPTPPGAPPPPYGPTGAGFPPNALPQPNPNLPPTPTIERRIYYRRRLGPLLLAGLIGYYFGRKAGRRKQEAEMRPKLERLAKDNEQLRQEVMLGEHRIKRLRRIQAEHEAALNAPPRIEEHRAESHVGTSPLVAETEPSVSQKAIPEKETPTLEVTASEGAPPLPTVERADTSVPSQEAVAEATPPSEVGAAQLPRPEALSEPEIMELAKNVRFEGVSAIQMYREGRLDKESLRRVVTEYVRGGSPERVLATELATTEVRHAQSPEFVDGATPFVPPTGQIGVGGGGGAETGHASSDHLLPAYDGAKYPSDSPEHLLPEHALPEHPNSGKLIAATVGVLTILGIIAALLLV